jgi:hypothetical protein
LRFLDTVPRQVPCLYFVTEAGNVPLRIERG